MPRESSYRQRSSGGFRDINLTPLIDVMLVLLIVFMITAPLLTSGLPVDLPKVSADPAPIHDTRLVVSIDAEGKTVYQDRDISSNVRRALVDDEDLKRSKRIYIRADENVRYKYVARVVAAARAAGVEALNLVVEAADRDSDESG